MKSKITLYYKSLVNKEKNFVLDNQDGTSALETYLSTLTSESINEFQYVKQGLSVAIKLNKSQVALEMVDSKDLNYVKIQNYDVVDNQEVLEKPYYYFVIAKNWRAKDTIELVLSMDTLNTFRFNYDYRLNKKTLTKRMHKDRFELLFPQSLNWMFSDFPDDVDYTLGAGIIRNQSYDGKLAYKMNENDVIHYIPCKFIFMGTKLHLHRFSIHIDNQVSIDLIMNSIRTNTDALIIGLTDENEETYYISFTDFYAFDFFDSNHLEKLRKIDFKSEDISAPVYRKEEHNLYEQEGEFKNSWALYYKNRDNQDDSPIECYLASDVKLDFLTETGSNTISVDNIPVGKILFICPQYQGNVTFDVDGVKHYVNIPYSDVYNCVGFKNDNGVLVVIDYIFTQNDPLRSIFDKTDERSVTNPTQVVVDTPLTQLKVREVNSIENHYAPGSNFPFDSTAFNRVLNLQPLTTRILESSSTIDKTLSENLKIINIPYCPTQLKKENDKYIIGGEWGYDVTKQFFKLVDFTPSFKNLVTSDVDSILNIFTSGIISPNLSLNRTIIDSKLYHSDYYRPKFVYDSFSRIFPLEQIDYAKSYESINSDKFTFTFVMSRNIVSKFLFKFDFVYKHSNEDYPNVVAVARNNEEVLYNSAYLNYVRTGYNYDLKSKERQESSGAIGLGLNIAGLIASIGLSFIPGGQALGVAGVVGSSLGLVGQMVNYAKTTAQNEENIQRKLQETQRQAVSVLNADDYDLLQAYTDNKAKLCLYEVSDNMKRVLDDLFYYCGYLVNEQMIPDAYSRYWFNFVQAGLIIEDSSNLNSDIENDIKEKFEQGVTFLHYHNKFDFVQEMENWETSLL